MYSEKSLHIALFMSTQKKTAILSNEIRAIIGALRYKLGMPLDYLTEINSHKVKYTSVKRSDYQSMLIESDILLNDITSHLKHLHVAFKKCLNAEHQKNKMHFWFVRSYVEKALERILEVVQGFNLKFDQHTESAYPNYFETPSFLKRYQNTYFQEFITQFSNKTLLPILSSSIRGCPIVSRVVVHWEHRNEDAIKWGNKGKTNQSNTLFLEESYWALDHAIHIPHIVHELAHGYLHELLNNRYIDESIDSLATVGRQLRRQYLVYLKSIRYLTNRPEAEFLCDFVGLVLFGEAYILSLFLHIFAHDLHQFVPNDIENLDNVNWFDFGGIPTIRADSWWIRLKVLCDLSVNLNKGKKSAWISSLELLLLSYHSTIEKITPTPFVEHARFVRLFEKNAANLISDVCSILPYTNDLKDLKSHVKKLDKRDKIKFTESKINELCNYHFQEYFHQFNQVYQQPIKIENIKDLLLLLYRDTPQALESTFQKKGINNIRSKDL